MTIGWRLRRLWLAIRGELRELRIEPHARTATGKKKDEGPLKCQTAGCEMLSVLIVYWPGQTTRLCGFCSIRAVGIARHMGFDLATELDDGRDLGGHATVATLPPPAAPAPPRPLRVCPKCGAGWGHNRDCPGLPAAPASPTAPDDLPVAPYFGDDDSVPDAVRNAPPAAPADITREAPPIASDHDANPCRCSHGLWWHEPPNIRGPLTGKRSCALGVGLNNPCSCDDYVPAVACSSPPAPNDAVSPPLSAEERKRRGLCPLCGGGWGHMKDCPEWLAAAASPENTEPGRSGPDPAPPNPLRVTVPPFKFGP